MLLNEKLTRARATYEKMMEQSIAKYSQQAYTNNYHSQQPYTPVHSFAPTQYGQDGQAGSNYSTAPYQTQYAPTSIQGQAPAAPYQQDSQYAPYTPQLAQQQPVQPQIQQQPPQQQQQPTFDQAYAQQLPPQSQASVDYSQQPQQQYQQQSQPQQQQQQSLPPVQNYQGYQQQPVQGNDFSNQQQQQQPTAYAQQTNGYVPQPQAAGVPMYQ